MKQSVELNSRLGNFELLRIFSMFLIVLHHCTAHGVFSYWHDNSSIGQIIRNLICFLLSSGGEIGVTLFILLTGYFSCQQKFKLKKCIDVYLKTWFFSILICAGWLFINPPPEMTISLFLFPLSQSGYWFVTYWLLMLSFSPFLNSILKENSPKTVRNYLIYGAVLWVILPMFGFKMGYSFLLYFMYLYLLGGAIRLQYIDFSNKYFALASVAILEYFFLFFIISFFSSGDKINLWFFWKYTDVNSIYTLTFSLWIFHLFENLKVKSLYINWIATSMFSVYLLHNHDLIRPYLWHILFKIDTSMGSFMFVVWAFTASFSIFCFCIILDKFLSLIYMPIINCIEKNYYD